MYIDSLSWTKKYVVYHIPHKHSAEMEKISEVFPLGIINENETTLNGMIKIMQEQHELVPGHNTNTLVRIFSVGDLLTVERQQGAQKDLCDSPTPSRQLLGLIPALADFHSYGNFLEAVWHILYNAGSSADIGTLFQARNFLGAKAVPGSPMNDLNACEDLLFLYTEALIVATFRNYEKCNKVEASSDENSDRELMDSVLTDLIEKYIIPLESVQHNIKKGLHECQFCGKRFHRITVLRKHIKEHRGKEVSANRDSTLNYTKNALALGYIAKNFVDARKHGDGERLIRLYKYLLLYYKIDCRHKYAYQTLHLLAQVSYLLPQCLSYELTWNRFVNTKGAIDSNVELDRHLEHHNRYVKQEFARWQGKLTEKSIARASRSYSAIQKILALTDAELSIVPPSGRHSDRDRTNDVKELAELYDSENLFNFQPGRYHSQFPGFPESYIDGLNLTDFKQWVFLKLTEFNRKSIYQEYDIVVTKFDEEYQKES